MGAHEPNRSTVGRDSGAHKTADRDTGFGKGAQEIIGKLVSTAIKKRGERTCLVVPAPAPTEGGSVLHRDIKHHVAGNVPHAILTQRVDDGTKIVAPEKWIHSSANVNVLHARRIVGFATGLEGGGETIVGTEQIESRNCGEHLHVRSRAQALMLTAHEDRAIVGEIIDTNAYLRTLEQRIAEQGVETTGNDTGKNARRTLSGGERGGISDKIFHERVGNATLCNRRSGNCGGNRTMRTDHEDGETKQTEEK